MSRREFLSKFIPGSGRSDRKEETGSGEDTSDENEKPADGQGDVMTRREFVKALGVGVAAGLIGVNIPDLPDIRDSVGDSLIRERLSEEIERKRRLLRDRYGLRVYTEYPPKDLPEDRRYETTKPSDSPFAATPRKAPKQTDGPDVEAPKKVPEKIEEKKNERDKGFSFTTLDTLSEQNRALDLLTEEMSFFPQGIIRRSRLKSIYLVGSMMRVLELDDGNRQREWLRGSLGDVSGAGDGRSPDRRLILSCSGDEFNSFNFHGWTDGDTRPTFMHEMLHALDEIDAEDWYQAVVSARGGKGLEYAVSQEQKDDFGSVHLSHAATPGFARTYGRTNQKEDRATVFEFLTKHPSHEQLERVDGDPILARKIAVVAGFLLGRSSGLMDGRYWDIVRSGKRPPDGYYEHESARILTTPYEDYVADFRNFETGGIRIMGVPSQEEFAAWQANLRKDYPGIKTA